MKCEKSMQTKKYTNSGNHSIISNGFFSKNNHIIICKKSKDMYASTKIIFSERLMDIIHTLVYFINDIQINYDQLILIDNAISVVSSELGYFLLLEDGRILTIFKKISDRYHKPNNFERYLSFYGKIEFGKLITNIIGCMSFFGIFCEDVLYLWNYKTKDCRIIRNVVWYVTYKRYIVIYSNNSIILLGNCNDGFDSLFNTEFMKYFNNLITDNLSTKVTEATEVTELTEVTEVPTKLPLENINFRIFDEDVVIIVNSKIKVFDNYKVDILEYFESLDGVLDIIKITGVECYCILFECGCVGIVERLETEVSNDLNIIYLSIYEGTCISHKIKPEGILNNPIVSIKKFYSYFLLIDMYGNIYVAPTLFEKTNCFRSVDNCIVLGNPINSIPEFENVDFTSLDFENLEFDFDPDNNYTKYEMIVALKDKEIKFLTSELVDVTDKVLKSSEKFYMHENTYASYI